MDVADPFVNIGNTAGLYSQIAGVLAGFAFTGLLLYLNRTPEPSVSQDSGAVVSAHDTDLDGPYDTRRDVAVVLYNTLGALVICAILYGQLAGGDPDSHIAFSSVLLNGLAFSLAILGMFYATALAATPFPHLTAMVAAARFLVGTIGPTICMALIASAALDLDAARCTAQAPARGDAACRSAERITFDSPYGLALLLTGIIALISLGMLFLFRRPTARPQPWIAPVIAWIILGSAIITVGVNVYLTTQPADYLLPTSVLRVLLFVTFLVLCCFSGMTARSCHYVEARANGPKGDAPSVRQAAPSPRAHPSESSDASPAADQEPPGQPTSVSD